MTNSLSAITELSQIIQPGDCITLRGGGTFPAVSAPANPVRQRKGHEWIVAIRTFVTVAGEQVGIQLPVNLYAVERVERGGRVIWDRDGEKPLVQREMFAWN